MNKLLLTIITIITFGTISLFSSQKQTDNIAQISASSLYNIDKNSLQSTVKAYIKNEPNLKALKIVESLSGETYVTCYEENQKVVYDKALPSDLSHLTLYKSTAMLENEIVGEVFAYYDESQNTKLSQEEVNWLRSNPPIRIAVVTNYPPYDFFDSNNELQGYHTDLIRLMNTKLNTNIMLVPFPSWKDAYNSAIKGEVNAIFSLSWSEQREKNHFIYTLPYHLTPYPLLVQKDNYKIHSLEYLKGKKVAVEAKTIFADVIKEKVPSAKISYGVTIENTLKLLSRGTVDAVLSSNSNPKLIEKYNLKVATEIFHKSSELYIGTNKKYPIVSSILEKGVKSISLKEMNRLQKRWLRKGKSDIELSYKEKSWLENNQIILSIDDKYAPMNFRNNQGKMDGLSIDYIKLIEKKIGYPIRLNTADWPIALGEALSHKTDGIINANSTPERGKKLIFTNAYVTVPMLLVTNKEVENYGSLTELNNKTIVVKSKTAEASILIKKYPNIKIKEAKNYQEALEMVSLNKVDGVFGHMAVLEYEMNQYMIPNLKKNLISFNDIVTSQRIGVRNTAPLLKDILNKAIVSISTQEKQRISEKWMSTPSLKQKVVKFSKEEMAWLRKNPLIKVAVMNYWFKNDNGDSVHTDLIKLLNKYSDFNIIPVKYDAWTDGFNDAVKGINIHAIMNLSWSKEREEKYFYYTKPYTFLPSQLIVKNSNTHIKNLKDLKNKTVYIRAKTIAKKTLEDEVPSSKIIPLKKQVDMYEKLYYGSNDEAILDYSTTKEVIEKYNLKIVQNVYDKYSQVSIGVSKEHEQLFSIINKIYQGIPEHELLDLQSRVYKKSEKSPTVKLTSEEKDWVKKNPVIKVIEFFEEPPFTMNTLPKMGYMYELLEYLTTSAGFKIQYVDGHTSYSNMLESIEKSKADILTTFPTSLDLGKDSNIVASKSVLKTPFVMVGKSRDTQVNSVEDLFGKKVAVVKGYAQDKYLSKFPKIEKVYVKNNEEGFNTIREGKSQYYINNRANTEYVLNVSFATDLKIVYELPYNDFPPLSISFAMNAQKKTMVSILKKALQQMPYQKIRAIQDKWIVQEENKNTKRVHLTAEEKAWVTKHPKIRVHNEQDWAPYNFYEKGRARGLSIDFMKALALKAGIEVEFVSGPSWNEFMSMAKTKEIDVMLNIVQSKEREKFLKFTNPYSELLQSLYIREGESPITDTKELFGKTFAVPKGFYYEEKLKEFPQIKLLRLNNTLECIQAVSFGKADAMLDLTAVVDYYKSKFKINNVVMGGTLGWEGGSLPLKIGVRDDWPELVSILDKSLALLTDKELDDIEDKWLFGNSQAKTKLVALTKEEKKWIRNNTVKVGIEEWAPIIFSHGGKDFDGITGDVLRLVIEKTGLNIEIVNDLWDPLLTKFKNKELDLLPATYYTDERATFGLFSQGYYKMLDYVYIREDNDAIRSMEDLRGKHIGVPKGFGTIPKIREKYPEIEIVETRDLSDSIQRVLRGELDALYDGQIAVEYKMQEELIVGLKGIPQKSFAAAPIHFFSHIDKPILRDIIEKALNEIPVYEINKIKSKWLVEKRNERLLNGIESKNNAEDTWWLIISAVGVFLFLLLILLLITRFISNDFIAKSFGSVKFRIIALVILSLIIFMLSILVSMTLTENKKSALGEVKSDLEFVLKTTQDRLNTWMTERKNFLLQVGRDSELVIATNALLKVEKNPEALKKSEELKVVREFFEKRKKEFGTLGFFIIDKEFISIGSRRDTNIGTQNLIAKHHPKLLDEVFKGKAVFIPPIESDVVINVKKKQKNEHTMFFAIPIQDKNGNVIAAMTQRLDVEGEFSRIIQSGRIGKSGESYLFSKDAFMLTKSRFKADLIELGLLKPDEKEYESIQIRDPGGDLTQGYKPIQVMSKLPLTKMAQKAISLDQKTMGRYSKVHSDVEGYRDYRGVNVFGAWMWYNEFGFGLATEEDVEEALSGYYILRQNLLIITGLTLVLTVMATVMLIILGEKATRSVQKANNELSKLLSSFDENVIASRSDLKGRVTYASKAFCEISGYSNEELIGKPHSTVRHPDTPKELFKELWTTIQSGHIWRGEVKNKKKNGSAYWVEVVITPEFDEDNNIMGYSAIRQDITSKKEVEALSANLEIKVEERTSELKEQQQQFTSMAANVPGVIYRCKVDAGWTMLYISNEIETLSGYPVSDFLNNNVRTFADIMHEDDIKPVALLIKNQISKGEKFLVDYRVIDNVGVVKWVRSQGQAYKSDDGEEWLDGVLFDVTEQRKLEENIKLSEKRFLTLFDAAPDSIAIIKDGEYIDCNQKTLEIFGVKSVDQFMKSKPSDYSPALQENGQDSESLAVKKITTAIENGYNRFEWVHKRIDTNVEFDAEVILSSIELAGVAHIYAVVRDITERKRLERQIKENQEQMTFVSQYANLGFWNFNPQLGDLHVNDIFVQMLGYNSKEVLMPGFENKMFKPFKEGLAFWEQLLHPDDVAHTNKTIVAHINGETELYKVDYRMRRADGSWMWSTAIGRIAEYNDDGKPIRFNGVNIDIDETKRAQEAIIDQKQYTDSIMNSQSNIVISTDGLRLRTANKAFFDFYELNTVEEFLEEFGDCICDTFDVNAPKEFIQKMMGEEKWIEYVYARPELIHKAIIERDGVNHIFTITSDRFEFAGEMLEVAVFTDITELEKIREEVEAIHKHTQSSIEYASLIQHSLIPSNDFFKKYFEDYFTIWHPKDIVGGDIYLFEELRNENECLLMVIDCTGHGVPGAFVTMLVKAIERQVAAIIASDENMEVSPAWILKYFNQTMKKLLKQEDDEAISNAGFDGAVLYYNKKDEVVRFAGAELPLFYIEDGEFKTIKGNRHSIGYKKSDANYEFKEHVLDAKEGMQFYLSTDGYFDQNGGEKGFPFGKKRFIKTLEEYKDYSFADQQEVLLNELQDYQQGEDRNDDISVVGVKVGKVNKNSRTTNESWVI